MRECTIPPLSRFTKKLGDGHYSVEISRDWMKEFFDYEEQGSIEHLERLNKRDQVIPPVTDFVDGEAVDFCQVCNTEILEDDCFCSKCGQRVREANEEK